MLLAVFAANLGCTGVIGDADRSPPVDPRSTGANAAGSTATGSTGATLGPGQGGGGASALRRLSRVEYDNTLEDLLGDTTRSGFAKLPEEVITPDIAFDTNIATQQISAQLIAAAESLARDAAARAFRDPVARKNLVPCTPTGPADAGCMKSVISKFGRRAFRRTLSEEEVARYLAFQSFAVEENDFYSGAELVVRAMLQEPEFLYRLEIGAPVAGQPGLFKLNGLEMATRLSYFLRGTTPSEPLLVLGEAGQLSTPDQVRAAATDMLTDPRVRERVQLFHAEWLSYQRLQLPDALAMAMRDETRALLNRVIFDQPSSYLDVFTSKETFVDDTLAAQYGLPAPGSSAAWVSYGTTNRVGILSHGSVLSAVTKAGDTSPTLRGRYVSTRLMCRPIPPPPPNVVVDTPSMGDTTCKKDRLAAHRTSATCAACHGQMDPIGFGLENYDREARYRTTEEGRPQCAISGDGSLPDVGAFKGVDGLAAALTTSGNLESCVVREMFRFAMGRDESTDESAALQPVIDEFEAKKQNLREILVSVSGAESFGLRRDDTQGAK